MKKDNQSVSVETNNTGTTGFGSENLLNVPIGFTYVQLSDQKSPTDLWPSTSWKDVTNTTINNQSLVQDMWIRVWTRIRWTLSYFVVVVVIFNWNNDKLNSIVFFYKLNTVLTLSDFSFPYVILILGQMCNSRTAHGQVFRTVFVWFDNLEAVSKVNREKQRHRPKKINS